MAETPDEIVIVYNSVGAEGGSASKDPVADPQKQFINVQESEAVDLPHKAFLGNGALDAAKGAASAPGVPAYSLPLSFSLGNERVSMRLTPETFSDVLLGLYIAGGWEWVQPFLYSVGSTLLPVDVLRPTRNGAHDPARLQAFIRAAQTAISSLNEFIASTLVAIAEQAAVTAQDLAARTLAALDEQERLYGIRQQDTAPPAGGTEGGTGTNPQGTGTNSGTGGSGGTTTPATPAASPVYETTQPEMAADLVQAIESLAAAYSAVEGEQAKQPKSSTETSAGSEGGSPGTSGNGATGGSGGSGGSTVEEPFDQKKLDAAHTKLSTLLKDTSAQHKLAPGIFALCLPKRKAGAPLGEQAIYQCAVTYLTQARQSLAQVPATYDSGPLAAAIRGSLPRAAFELNVGLQDRPETRAAVFAGRTDRPGLFEPLLADQVLEHVRLSIVDSVKGVDGDDDRVRAGFALAVLNSYLGASDARYAIPRAQEKKDQGPLQSLGKVSAALSLVGLFFPPFLAIGGAIGLVTMFGSALTQLDAVASANQTLDRQALDALLTENDAAFAQILAAKPRGIDVITSIGVSVAEITVLNRVFPLVGLGVGAWSDYQTLAGEP